MSPGSVDPGRLPRVKLRSVGINAAGDFTPWLAQGNNLQLFGETIGIELERRPLSIVSERAVPPWPLVVLQSPISPRIQVLSAPWFRAGDGSGVRSSLDRPCRWKAPCQSRTTNNSISTPRRKWTAERRTLPSGLRLRRSLRKQGWNVLVVWECCIRDGVKLERKLSEFMNQ